MYVITSLSKLHQIHQQTKKLPQSKTMKRLVDQQKAALEEFNHYAKIGQDDISIEPETYQLFQGVTEPELLSHLHELVERFGFEKVQESLERLKG
ncbi:hypothetical protein ACFYKX_11590 [Cytobacillus sp. FJAT-54145]|uniref:Uncharacterized protein n=1 Tax=Cytobacillus spartinae TaxID=3299023 RepID=A0ABW6KAQ5_9BACI